jgi:hypothetical protein
MSAAQNESAAWPKAEDPALVQELLDCVQQASHYRQLKKGAVSLPFQSVVVMMITNSIPERSDQVVCPRFPRIRCDID